ncbi:glycosyltransferase family 4 protein [Sporichthya polymorpha]|uniref:glycosyltransferase family 4 protein n=1 Tax=Sporichthya polymorpha TaxID=35751 RepID=UPI00146B8AA8|nr:glycosyltransferase family 4 protein [Sporichthya polymorpha]
MDLLRFGSVESARVWWRFGRDTNTVVISHNDCLVGDIFVNHGLLAEALRRRYPTGFSGRNPIHWYLLPRDWIKYSRLSGRHAVVCLNSLDAELLTSHYPRCGAPISVIPNGVELTRFSPPTPSERIAARSALGFNNELTALFVGHEFERKGLHVVLQALRDAPSWRLVVVGGDAEQIRAAQASPAFRHVADRVVYVGSQSDARPFYIAADALVLPTQYETAPLVLLEALACGIPCLMTETGLARDLIGDDLTGYVVAPNPSEIARRLQDLQETFETSSREVVAEQCRDRVMEYSWLSIGKRYADLIDSVHRTKSGRV